MSTLSSADASYSSHDFVRTLRSAADPPVIGGPSKIEIAQEAWGNPFFYVPSKSEVIADWILTKLLKDKVKAISLNPIFDVKYWRLLSNVFGLQEPSSRSAVSRPEKAWLVPLLHRVPLGPIVLTFLGSFHELDEMKKEDLADAVSTCLTILWPTGVQRIATETLQECFGALLLTHSLGTPSTGISRIGHTICNSYTISLTNSSNKKKLYQNFVQLYLRAWIHCIENVLDMSFRKIMLEAGIETLLNLDILRQNLDLKGESTLLEMLHILITEDRDIVLKILPIIFTFYIDVLKKNRRALFGQGSQHHLGSSVVELHNTALRFFVSISSLIDDSHQDRQTWETRLALLQTIDRENIFSRQHVEAQVTVDQIIELALTCIEEGWKEDDSDCSGVAVSCISIIARIDHELILPFIPRLLTLLLHVSIPTKAHFEFLDILLNYHIKTRSMGTFVQNLFSAISDTSIVHPGSLKAYQLSFSSPVMHNVFLERLSNALQKFLTDSQSQVILGLLFTTTKKTWDSLYDGTRQVENEPPESPQKKRKVDKMEVRNAEESAVTYSLISRLASVVISSLPIQSLSADTLNFVKDSVLDFRRQFLDQSVLKSIKAIRKHAGIALWPTEVTLAATLRLLYALNVSRTLPLPPHYDERATKNLINLVTNDHLLPELTLELFRILFYHLSSRNPVDKDEVIGPFFHYLEKNFTSIDVRWSGYDHHLTKGEPGRAESALALLHIVIERWLPEIDRLASTDQLRKLLQVVISINMPSRNRSREQMDPRHLLVELLHSAQFWEFRNVRIVFLALIDEMTAPLASTDFKLLDCTSTIRKQTHIYRHLLLFPMEYFSWQNLNDLSKRCISADMALKPSLPSEDSSIAENLTILRIFLKRVFTYCNSISQDLAVESSEFFIHLLLMPFHVVDNQAELVKVTLELTEIYLAKLLKASKKNGPKAVLDVLASFKPDVFCKPLEISAQVVILLAELLERDFPLHSLPEEVIAAIRQLHQDILSSLAPRFESTSEMHSFTKDKVENYCSMISGWHTLLGLQKWLAQSESSVQTVKMITRNLTSDVVPWLKNASSLPSHECAKLCVDVFAILLQELEMLPAVEHPQQLYILISVYILFSESLSAAGRKIMDAHLARACRKLAVPDYVHALSFISDSLSNTEHLTCGRLQHLVDLATLVLREHPTHSLVHVQKFTTSCLSVFDSRPIFVQGPRDLRLKVLDMVSMHCSDQQAALRLADAAAIWLLLSKYLAPSRMHDDETDFATFHKVISIVGSLIRLRRDLVCQALPHAGGILRQLMFSLRACRPNLGRKQTSLVMDSLPRWINAKHPLGAEEAKALGRLFESLAMKTVVRSLGSSTAEPQKAESLAKPFSKHAAYVLQAYVESMNDPLCILSLETRKELEAGLFALCSIISEHSRDSLMISALDAGGKAVLKALWKNYEKQRYVGKG
ncbi:Urb2/Npa2 family-domain-containing protein [Gymnopilus junonius]|uniref:Urb2/Npa2 family-domain-containing protein n=1 Tax=Gymnopilus junonius TaxID=109634 RepID=A0A9P5NM27_GYMJU|nr:Urb2/Npa2 family-domain-containing protein [Gymnopilus junonius]